MDFLKMAEERYSVRKFENKHLEKEVVEKILRAGHIAPTGCNYQPQRILILNTDESIEKLRDCTKCHFNAPTAMLVCYNKEESWQRKYDGALSAPVDAAIVTTHMMLEAHSIGVGTCWVMHFNPFEMLWGIPILIQSRLICTMKHVRWMKLYHTTRFKAQVNYI